jgi:hypothetical protein
MIINQNPFASLPVELSLAFYMPAWVTRPYRSSLLQRLPFSERTFVQLELWSAQSFVPALVTPLAWIFRIVIPALVAPLA